jgi:hypothetical protein
LMTRDTVIGDTPARSATCFKVMVAGRAGLRPDRMIVSLIQRNLARPADLRYVKILWLRYHEARCRERSVSGLPERDRNRQRRKPSVGISP